MNKLAIDHVTLTVKSEQKATLADVHGRYIRPPPARL